MKGSVSYYEEDAELYRITAAAMSVAMISALLPLDAARADAIDGDWCHLDGRRIVIDGDNFVTPGGRKITGEYDRHAYAYVVPAQEPGAGSKTTMQLIDDDTIHVVAAAAPGPAPLVWRRCQQPTS